MGAVFRPKDRGRGYTKIIENAIRDLSPDTKDNVIKLFNSWEGTSSKEKLNEMMGPDKTKDLLKKIKAYDEADLTDEERTALNEITNQYADFVITNVKADPDKVSFDIGSPSMEDLTAKDIEFRLKEYLDMNIPPFEVKELKVQ